MRRGKLGFWYRLAVFVIKPLSLLLTRRVWRGQQHIPRTGGVIVAANHVSYVDPLTFSHFVYEAQRLPKFLAKIEVFSIRWPFGAIVRGARQIPVHRHATNAADSLRDAVAALRAGECVIIYPEGTVTRDPAYWPMRAHTGVARLALESGAPVVPAAQWGPQYIYDRYAHRLALWPRKTVYVTAGPPVDLSAFAGRPPTAEVLRAATDTVMAAVRALLGEIRGEQPPAEVFDPRAGARGSRGDQGRREERRSA